MKDDLIIQELGEKLKEGNIDELEKEFLKVRELMAYYRCAIMEVETKFNVLNEQFSLLHERNPIEGIKSRIKRPISIQEKLQKKGKKMTAENIENELNDVAGVRVICSFVNDIYMLADCLTAQDDIVVLKEKDYIKNPKGNGYRSLHLIIQIPIFLKNEKKMMKVEVQLRTIAMEFWANLEHRLRYKKELSEEVLNETAKELQICADMSWDLDDRMQRVKDRIEWNLEDEKWSI